MPLPDFHNARLPRIAEQRVDMLCIEDVAEERTIEWLLP
jgi:hypothetical protein